MKNWNRTNWNKIGQLIATTTSAGAALLVSFATFLYPVIEAEANAFTLVKDGDDAPVTRIEGLEIGEELR